jgi:hypothetical protein
MALSEVIHDHRPGWTYLAGQCEQVAQRDHLAPEIWALQDEVIELSLGLYREDGTDDSEGYARLVDVIASLAEAATFCEMRKYNAAGQSLIDAGAGLRQHEDYRRRCAVLESKCWYQGAGDRARQALEAEIEEAL